MLRDDVFRQGPHWFNTCTSFASWCVAWLGSMFFRCAEVRLRGGMRLEIDGKDE
jgi:hypothetical protein